MTVIVIVAALTLLGLIREAYVWYIILASALIMTVVLFSVEMRRDLYKMAIKQEYDTEESFTLTPEEKKSVISSIVKSCQSLSKNDTGGFDYNMQ